MKWKDLRLAADTLSGQIVQRNIWSLSEDARFPAVLALLEDVRFGRLAQGSSIATAGDHGAMAHCMGAVDAIDEIEKRIQTMIESPSEEKNV